MRTAFIRCDAATILLLVQMLAVGGWLQLSGRLVPVSVNDTPGYVNFPWGSWHAALDDFRTPGYPALLRVTRQFWNDQSGDPAVHYFLYCVGVLVFAGGVRWWFDSPSCGCAAASALLYSRILHGYVMTIATDTVAAGLGIAAVGCTLRWMRRRTALAATSIALTVAAGWLVRPANLFLVAVPAVMVWLLGRGDLPSRALTRRLICTALALTITPLLAYSAVRYLVTGRTGVVSFGWYNQIGVVGQFLEPEDVERLPPDLRPLAEAALRRRAARTKPATPYDLDPKLHYSRVEAHYDITCWQEFEPAARQLYGDSHGRINAELGRMSRAMIALRPLDYAVWLAKATRQAVKKILWDFADNPVQLGLLLAAGLLLLLRDPVTEPSTVESTARPALCLLQLAIAYAVLALGVVIPVCPPMGRWTDAAAVLWCAPLAVWVWEQLWSCVRNLPGMSRAA